MRVSRKTTKLPDFTIPLVIAAFLSCAVSSQSANAQEFDENGMPTYKPIGHHCPMKLPPPNPTGDPDLRLEGNGGYDPLRYDYDVGILVDPVTGIPDPYQGKYGDITDKETGAKFSTSLGLWIIPDETEPLRNSRLNTFPYYDPKTHEIINPVTGDRTPYEKSLLTAGRQRMHIQNIAYACLGSDLSQRVDPVSGQYVARTRVSEPNDFAYDTAGISFGVYMEERGVDDHYEAVGFPHSRHFTSEYVYESTGLVNGMSREEVGEIMYKHRAPESAEFGLYELKERRIEDGLVVVITAKELGDDAVHAEQYYLYFKTDMPGKNKDYAPRLMNVGYRHKCSRNGMADAWTVEKCP